MKSAEVLRLVAFMVILVCGAFGASNKTTNGDGNSVTEAVSDESTATQEPLEDPTTKNASEDDSTGTNSPSDESPNETATTIPPVTSVPSVTLQTTSSPKNIATTTPSVNQASNSSGGDKRLSTEVDKSKCESLGIDIPNAADCKCYKQKSAGTDTPQGFCYYYECAGNPPTLSKHKCEWVGE